VLILDKSLALDRMLVRASTARIPAVFAIGPAAEDGPPATPLPIGAWLLGAALRPLEPDLESSGAPALAARQ
jgi:hypothetical protein